MSSVSSIFSLNVNSLHSFKLGSVLEFGISYARNDGRPYLEVSILGHKVLDLLDSGASRTIVGLSGFEIFESLGLKLFAHNSYCTVDYGVKCHSLGYMQVPVCLVK